MNYFEAESRAVIFKALAHPVRVMIVDALSRKERCVCELNDLAKIDQSNISRHLAALKAAGIVADRREGMKVYYRLHTPCILKAVECAMEAAKTHATRQIESALKLAPGTSVAATAADMAAAMDN